MRRALAFGLGSSLILALGCISSIRDPLGKQDALEESQRRYTELVRWGEIETASAFVDPNATADYLALAERLGELRFTDFETGPIRFGDDANTATVDVVYHTYSTRTLVTKTIRERQEWYRDAGLKNEWKVRSDLESAAGRLESVH